MGREEGDELGGTAAEVRRWLLLEYERPWSRRAVEDHELSPAVAGWLREEVAREPGTRLLFVRRRKVDPIRARRDGSLFEVRPAGSGGTSRQVAFRKFDEIATLDLGSVEPVPSPGFLLTCTNARRDRCCARFGVPVHEELRHRLPDEAWECTHTGGHRYAASVVSLPDGAYYGFLDASVVPRLVAARRRTELLLEHYRGRAHYPRPAQAADVWIRRRRNLRGLGEVSLDGVRDDGGDRWVVTLRVSGEPTELEVRRRSVARLSSCSPAKTKNADEYSVTDR